MQTANAARSQDLGTLANHSRAGSAFDFQSTAGAILRVRFLTPDMVRVRLAPEGQFAESVTERWGYVRDQWDPVPVTQEEGETCIDLRSQGSAFLDRKPVAGEMIGPQGINVNVENTHLTAPNWKTRMEVDLSSRVFYQPMVRRR